MNFSVSKNQSSHSEGSSDFFRTDADFSLEEQKLSAQSKYDISLEIMHDLAAQGYQPVFSISRQFLVGQLYLRPNKTWIQDRLLAGTMGIQSYNPEGDRILCVYKGDLAKIALKPRLTGPDQLFHGVVATLKEIPLSECELIDSQTGRKTSLIEINQRRDCSAHNEKSPEQLERESNRANLNEQFKNYQPGKLLDFLHQFASTEYDTPLGKGFGKFTIKDHTLRVLVQFEKYFKAEELPESFNRDFFRLFLSLHDLGKKQALEAGDSNLQNDFNKTEMEKMLQRFAFSADTILLAKMLVSFDPIGNVLKSRNPAQAAKFQFLKIQEYAREFKIPLRKFYQLVKIYYMSDASAYTSDAKFPPLLDEIFEFDKEYQGIYFSSKSEEKLEALEELIGASPNS